MIRYGSTKKIINNEKIYSNLFKNRGISQIEQYGARFLKYPTKNEILQLDIVSHTWSFGDMYYKLAYDNYGDPTLWWVIAACSGIGWGLQVPPGIYLKIPTDIGAIQAMLG